MNKNLMNNFIDQQPIIIEKVINDELTLSGKLTKEIKEIIFVGSGSSLHASKMGKIYFEKYTNFKTSYFSPTEYLERFKDSKNKYLLVAISQSGSSKTTLKSLELAKGSDNPTILISATNDEYKKNLSDQFIDLFCPTETIGPKTVGVLATFVRIVQLALKLSIKKNFITEAETQDVLSKVLIHVKKIPSVKKNIQEWIKEHKWWADLSYLTVTSDWNLFPVIEEGSLKLLETLRKPVLPYKIEDFTHGPHRLITKDSFHIFVASTKNTDTSYKVRSYAKEYTDNILYLSADESSDIFLDINNKQLGNEIIYLLVFQVLANELALLTGFNPDEQIHSEFFSFVGTKE